MTAMHRGLIRYHQDPARPATGSCDGSSRAKMTGVSALSLVGRDLG
jgi:hypothetical protein